MEQIAGLAWVTGLPDAPPVTPRGACDPLAGVHAAFAVLEMGNGAKSWFRPGGRYTDTYVARAYGEFALRVVGLAD